MLVIKNRQPYKEILFTPEEAEMAQQLSKKLSGFVQQESALTLQLIFKDLDEPTNLPVGVVALLIDILGAMGSGEQITILSAQAELTTIEAANLLNVSRHYLLELLDQKCIPYRAVGKERRIKLKDVMAYKKNY
jgi:excisionase family DNA binding protein